MHKTYAIGIDIGGTNIKAALVCSDGTISNRLKEPTGNQPIEVVDRIISTLYSRQPNEICGIGIGVAGVIDNVSGIVLRSPNIGVLTGKNLKGEIEKHYKTCIVVENDANAAAYGEKCAGAGKKFENFVMLTLGTGIGGGIVINDRIVPVAAEIGHMSINSNGPQCACGNVGCLESYASATAIISSTVSLIEKGESSILKEFHNGNFYKLNAEDIYKAALEGDALARTALREAGKSLGIGIANIINILSPDAVILAGGLIGAWNIYVDFALQEVSKRALKEIFAKTKIVPSSLGEDAGIIGAAQLIFDKSQNKSKKNKIS